MNKKLIDWQEAINDLDKHFGKSDEFSWDIRMLRQLMDFARNAQNVIDGLMGDKYE